MQLGPKTPPSLLFALMLFAAKASHAFPNPGIASRAVGDVRVCSLSAVGSPDGQ